MKIKVKKFSTEKSAVVLKNPDGTHEVVSICSKEDEKRIIDYVLNEGCEVIVRCKNTAKADKYIDDHKLDRAY